MTLKTVVTKTHPSMGDSSHKLGTWHSLHSCRKLCRVTSVPFMWFIGLHFSQATPLVYTSSGSETGLSLPLQLDLFESSSHKASLYTHGREGLRESDQFQGLHESILSYLLCVVRSFPIKWNASTQNKGYT